MAKEVYPHAYTEFQPLEEILVGRGYSSKILDRVADSMSPTTKRLLSYLLDETEEDYQNFISVLKTYGAKVYRPEYPDNFPSSGYLKHWDIDLMQPRDHLIVLGNNIVIASVTRGPGRADAPLRSFNDIVTSFAKPLKKYAKYFKYDKHSMAITPPAIIRLGKDIIVDSNKGANTESAYNYIKTLLKPFGYNIIYTKTHNFEFEAEGCHADGCFAVLKPGVLLTLKPEYMYTDGLFPNWDACRLEDQSWTKMKPWVEFKNQSKRINSSYCFNDEKYNEKEFSDFINTWLSHWVGYAKATVFDVNVLSLDEQHVCVSNYNKKAFDYFKKHKIEPIIVPFRHRYFWDGGLHCITLDIKRRGNIETYL